MTQTNGVDVPQAPMELEIDDVHDTARTETFSDGVIAIALTLLALEIHVPTHVETTEAGGLLAALAQGVPMYLAFATSFLVILVIWINHHRLFKVIDRMDHNSLILNGLLLMSITILPFMTRLVADYLREPQANIAVGVYALNSLGMALLFQAFWRYCAGKRRLIAAQVPDTALVAISSRDWLAPAVYGAAFLLAVVVNADLGFGLIVISVVWFAAPSRLNAIRRG